MCAKNHLLIFSSFLDIWENVEWPRFFGPPCICNIIAYTYKQTYGAIVCNNGLIFKYRVSSNYSLNFESKSQYYRYIYNIFVVAVYMNYLYMHLPGRSDKDYGQLLNCC